MDSSTLTQLKNARAQVPKAGIPYYSEELVATHYGSLQPFYFNRGKVLGPCCASNPNPNPLPTPVLLMTVDFNAPSGNLLYAVPTYSCRIFISGFGAMNGYIITNGQTIPFSGNDGIAFNGIVACGPTLSIYGAGDIGSLYINPRVDCSINITFSYPITNGAGIQVGSETPDINVEIAAVNIPQQLIYIGGGGGIALGGGGLYATITASIIDFTNIVGDIPGLSIVSYKPGNLETLLLPTGTKTIIIYNNPFLSTLDLSACSLLLSLSANKCYNLSSPILPSYAPNLVQLIISETYYRGVLDLAGYPNLQILNCAGCQFITGIINIPSSILTLNIGAAVDNPYVYAPRIFDVFDLSGLTALTEFSCYNSPISGLIIPGDVKASLINVSIGGTENISGAFDLSGFTSLNIFNCSNSLITDLLIPYDIAQNITDLSVSCTINGAFDLTDFNSLRNLTYSLVIITPSLTIPDNIKYNIISLDINNTSTSGTYDLSGFNSLTSFNCSYNNIDNLVIPDYVKAILQTLNIVNTDISGTYDLTGFTSLTSFGYKAAVAVIPDELKPTITTLDIIIDNNFDLTGFDALTYLSINTSPAGAVNTLIIPDNVKARLTYLNINGTGATGIFDITNFTSLTKFICDNNIGLTGVGIVPPNITDLNIAITGISGSSGTFDVSELKSLVFFTCARCTSITSVTLPPTLLFLSAYSSGIIDLDVSPLPLINTVAIGRFSSGVPSPIETFTVSGCKYLLTIIARYCPAYTTAEANNTAGQIIAANAVNGILYIGGSGITVDDPSNLYTLTQSPYNWNITF